MKRIRITEDQLHNIVMNTAKRVIKENIPQPNMGYTNNQLQTPNFGLTQQRFNNYKNYFAKLNNKLYQLEKTIAQQVAKIKQLRRQGINV